MLFGIRLKRSALRQRRAASLFSRVEKAGLEDLPARLSPLLNFPGIQGAQPA